MKKGSRDFLRAFIYLFRKHLYKRLSQKTGWGRIEIKFEIEQSIGDTLAEIVGERYLP